MNIKSMLKRLQSALGQDNLSEQMLLYSGVDCTTAEHPEGTTNFVISYNGSPNSQTALDFVLWMAHQTRLVSQQQVTVHVVYVIDCFNSLYLKQAAPIALGSSSLSLAANTPLICPDASRFQCGTVNLAPSKKHSSTTRHTSTMGTVQLAEPQVEPAVTLTKLLEQADRALWQARCLSDEWRGSLEAHLRFGGVSTELRQIVQEVKADLLFIGCTSVEHPLVQQLIPCVPCPILGIPTELEAI